MTLGKQGNAEILIVDNMQANIEILSAIFRKNAYRVRIATNGSFALKTIERNQPDLIILDVNMPDVDGYEICTKLKASEKTKAIPVIFISSSTEMLDKLKAFQAGGADYITKPFFCEEVEARVNTQLELRQYRKQLETMLQEKTRQLTKEHSAVIFSLRKIVESYDGETAYHLERVQRISRLLALNLQKYTHYGEQIDEMFIRNIYRASALHDIGKVGISDFILCKPGKLTLHEFEIMKTHTTLGAKILQAISNYYENNSFLQTAINIALYHHERWDGSGYPHGIAGETIPLESRIMAVADVYDAVRSKRCYKPAYSPAKARAVIMEGEGVLFDPVITQVFCKVERALLELYAPEKSQ